MNQLIEKKVSLIIPTIRQVQLVDHCLKSINRCTDYNDYEIIVIDDGSDREIQEQIKRVTQKYQIRFIPKSRNTGFAATVNQGALIANGAFFVLVNNDIEFFRPDWLNQMLKIAEQRDIGIVGARLLYPDGRIQHGGVQYRSSIKNFEHCFRYKPASYPEAQVTRDALAVTGALMMIKREVWRQLGGMSEDFFIAMEDVDFCLRAKERGWRVVYCGQAVAYHAEGKTRGTTPENKVKSWYLKELEGLAHFRKTWFDEFGNPRFKTEKINGAHEKSIIQRRLMQGRFNEM